MTMEEVHTTEQKQTGIEKDQIDTLLIRYTNVL